MLASKAKKLEPALLTAVLGMGITALIAALCSFAYLGIFSRYMADDYCETVLANSGSFINALIFRYQTDSDRYSNLIFDAMTEFLFPRHIQVVPVIMIVLWTIALIWLVREIKLFTGLKWPLGVDVFFGAMMSFFSILEAPNRFQVIYWRSAMATHFTPLVYITAFSALALLLIRKTDANHLPIWVGPLFMALAFLGGGFSEPPDAMLIVFSTLALAAVMILEKGPRRKSTISVLAWILAGGMLALLVMAVSPGNSSRLGISHPPGLVDLVYHTLLYAWLFLWDSFATMPIPSLLSIGMPFLLFYCLYQNVPLLSFSNKRMFAVVMLATPLLIYILIASSFAPSVYGQSFPEERARFAGQLMLIIALMLEGAYFGVALAQIKVSWRPVTGYMALGLLMVSVFYPVRAAGKVLNTSLPSYSQWASDWDFRQLKIFADKAQGIQDLVVPQLNGVEHTKELDPNPTFWINRCAARFYGVGSISAPSMRRKP